MGLATERLGSGPDLVLVHGWAMHSGVWRGWAQALAERFCVTLVDLPGHGASPPLATPGDLDAIAAAIAAVVPPNAWWCGWSLGALVGLCAAQAEAHRIRGLIGVAATPRFVAGPDWAPALEPGVLADFARGLGSDAPGTVRRFLALQVGGSTGATQALRWLRQQLQAQPLPALETLAGGLNILERADLRAGLAALEQPVLWLLGDRDRLVPAQLAAVLPSLQREITVHLIKGAGHAPFLCAPEHCAQWIAERVAAAETRTRSHEERIAGR